MTGEQFGDSALPFQHLAKMAAAVAAGRSAAGTARAVVIRAVSAGSGDTRGYFGASERVPCARGYAANVPDHLAPAERSKLMARVKSRDTTPELLLRRTLWAHGVRGWRTHPRGVPGKPDLAWLGRRIAIFVDGAFWHGHPDYYWGQSGKFWDDKIARNRMRDQRVNTELAEHGWTVLRFWDFEVARAPEQCALRVEEVLAVSGNSD
jgi:DNA mismatch endonuclease, patch repair protein